MRRLLIPLLLIPLFLTACGSSDENEARPAAEVDTLYGEATAQLENREYKSAIKSFEEVERQHPYSEWAVRAQVMAGYAAYRAGDYDQAVSILERFAKLHPGNDSVPYAYYLIALCYYEQITDVGRDQKITEQALTALTEIIKRFPESEYARDARLKLDLAYDHLAGKEMQVGRYYLNKDEYLSAVNRFRYVAENYQTTSHVPEALYRLVECYLRLGVEPEAKRYAAVLGHNYPGSVWYRDAYALMNGGDKAGAPGESGGWLDVW